MRLGFYSPNYPSIAGEGGIGTYTRGLARELSRRGHVVHVVVPAVRPAVEYDREVAVHLASAAYVPILDRLWPGIGSGVRIAATIRKLARMEFLDLVEFPNWEGRGLFYSFARPTPMVVRLSTSKRETAEIDGLPWGRTLRWEVRQERWAALRADLIASNSEAHRRRLAAELGTSESRIEVCPLGIDPCDRQGSPHNSRSADLTVVCLGRLEKRKGTLDLLRAIPEVLARCPDTQFVFIGHDRPHCPPQLTHQRWATENLPPQALAKILFTGVLPDRETHSWLHAADLLVSPSLYESFGLVFLEGMRCGLPVVGTRAGGIAEIIQDGHTGVLVNPGNPAQLATTLSGLLLDSERRLRMGEAGRRRFLATFTAERMAAQVEESYVRTLTTRTPARRSPRD